MTLSAEATAYLDANADLPQPPDVTVDAFRAVLSRVAPPQARVDGVTVTDVTVGGGDDQTLRLRVYRPTTDGPLPVAVWAHGGSFVRGTIDDFDGARSGLAAACCCVVVAVDQRLSPESTFPRPVHDVVAAYRWASRHAGDHGGDLRRVGLAGESSGANLAASAALELRDERDVPAFVLLLVPLLDATLESATVSAYGVGFGLDRDQLEWAYDQYAPGVPRTEPRLSPLH